MNVVFESARRARGQTYPLTKRAATETTSARSGRATQLHRGGAPPPISIARFRAIRVTR